MKKILKQVNSVIMKSADDKQEALDHFLKGIIVGIKTLSHIGPTLALSKVVQFKDRAIKTRVEEANRFIYAYNEFITEKELSWAELARHWYIPQSLEARELLKERTNKFESLAQESFEELRKNAERHNGSLIFILENYDVSKIEMNKISSIRKKLDKTSKITYKDFVKEITEA